MENASKKTEGHPIIALVVVVALSASYYVGFHVGPPDQPEHPDYAAITAAAEAKQAAEPDPFLSNDNAYRVTNQTGYACRFLFQSDDVWNISLSKGYASWSDIEAAGCVPMPKGTIFLPSERQFSKEWNGGGIGLVHTSEGDEIMHLDKIVSVRVH